MRRLGFSYLSSFPKSSGQRKHNVQRCLSKFQGARRLPSLGYHPPGAAARMPPPAGALPAKDASKICFRWPVTAAFRLSANVALTSYPSTMKVVQCFVILSLPRRAVLTQMILRLARTESVPSCKPAASVAARKA